MQISEKHLKPGDVLLYNGQGWISWAIKHFDSSPVSHASIYLGDGKVGEALSQGVISNSLAQSINNTEWVKVFRHKVSIDGDDMKPVLAQAENFIAQKGRYAYEQILLLGFICATRKIVGNESGPLVRAVIEAATRINHLLSDSNKEPMICSELVYRCYNDFAKPNRYSISLRSHDNIGTKSQVRSYQASYYNDSIIDIPEPTFSSVESGSPWDVAIRDNQLASVRENLEKLIEQYRATIKEDGNKNNSEVLGITSKEELVLKTREYIDILSKVSPASKVDPNFVTPGDLFTSSLVPIGQLKKG